MYTPDARMKKEIRPPFSGLQSLSGTMMKPHLQTSTPGLAATFVVGLSSNLHQRERSMVKNGHKLRHHKINRAKISHTYVFLQGLSIVLQTYQGGSVKTSRASQNPTNFLVVRRQPLERSGL